MGYPFTNEKQVEDALTKLLLLNGAQPAPAGSKADEIAEGDTIILVTHVGPHNADTTIDQVQIDAEPIQSGSHALRSALLDPLLQKRVLLNIHGHTHHATGLTRVGKIFVMNPGALRTGHFGILTLKRLMENKWQVSSSEFHRL